MTGDCYAVGRFGSIGFGYIVVDPAHVKARGAGGDDLWNAISLAHHLHEESHRIGRKSFEAKYSVDMAALAAEQTEQWLQTDDGKEWLAEHPTGEREQP